MSIFRSVQTEKAKAEAACKAAENDAKNLRAAIQVNRETQERVMRALTEQHAPEQKTAHA